jgi:orotidine 5'-phosphate decarboxylase subfamily 2
MTALEKLQKAIRDHDTLLCVGLDTDLPKIPRFLLRKKDPLFAFNKKIIDATSDLVCAYKINIAFYEALGPSGIESLRKSIKYIPKHILSILDAKRGDIGNTAEKYGSAIFDYFKADATTLNPYLGLDSLLPFVERPDKLSFVLCLTSNKSARDFQFLKVKNKPLYLKVARKVKSWNKNKNLGLVVGATHPRQLAEVRRVAGDLPFLIPGVGAQGGDLEKAVQLGAGRREMAVINSSREIIYASKNKDFASQARLKASEMYQKISLARRKR